MEDSAAEFSRFVDKVLDATGAAKVSNLGHSEGTVMPSYYVKFLGGASKVDKYVGLTPLWDGTTLYGLSHLYKWGQPLIDPLLNPLCGSCVEFL